MRPWLLWAMLACTAAPALWPGDAARAEAVWVGAVATGGSALTEPVYLDAAAALRDVSPLQQGWWQAQRRIRAVAQVRRSVLAHDRGGRRDGRDGLGAAP